MIDKWQKNSKISTLWIPPITIIRKEEKGRRRKRFEITLDGNVQLQGGVAFLRRSKISLIWDGRTQGDTDGNWRTLNDGFLETFFFSTQCGNIRIFLSFRFYVKSILVNIEVLNWHICHFWSCEFWQFGKIQPTKSAKNHTKSKFMTSKCVKIADFAIPKFDFT